MDAGTFFTKFCTKCCIGTNLESISRISCAAAATTILLFLALKQNEFTNLIQIMEIFGGRETKKWLPHLLGHEASGKVIQVGKNVKKALDEIGMVVEGFNATKVVYNISKRHKINMPIVNEVYSILFNNKNPKLAINDLMDRKLKMETL